MARTRAGQPVPATADIAQAGAFPRRRRTTAASNRSPSPSGSASILLRTSHRGLSARSASYRRSSRSSTRTDWTGSSVASAASTMCS
ncbi:MAG: hypothetical protein ACK559_32585, partial [bacterium]